VNSLVGSLLPVAERPFGNYELVSKIATGGMAEIFLARRADPTEDNADELVVIKRVLPHLLEESRFIAMFRDEARLASQIIHPNVCRVFDSGRVQGTYFIAMEYLHGVPMSRMLLRAARTKQHLSASMVVGLLVQCCIGLHHAHELKSRDGRPLDVVHRDVSPPNIFVTTDGLAKMLDFGVAKARGASQKTRTGTVKGKNSYMSPEQILGQEVDKRSDVFSLGIVLWEALSARRLFSRDTDFLTFTAITKAEVQDIREIREDISDGLAAVVNKSLAQDRDDRYGSAKELADALTAAMADDGGVASESEIAEFVSQRFSKELVSMSELTKDVAEQLDGHALDEGEPDGQPPAIEATARLPRSKSPTLPMVDPSIPTPIPPTNTELIFRGRVSRRWLIMAGVAATLVVLAFALSRDCGESASPAVATSAPDATVIAVVPPDAHIKITMDAGVPDAAVPTKPEVDKRPAYLTVDSSPYATIYVDGKKLGVTPIFKAKLKPGKHKLKAVSATGAKQTVRLKLKPGRTKNLGRLKW